MALAPNTKFDHYEILAPLGKGGMGEVYRAKDTRLNREVALKVLPAEFAQDADRLSRFEQEAKATSALNHPNILTVHDFGLYEGNPYIVAELLTGEELRAQLDNGALPVRKAIDYAQQIAASQWPARQQGRPQEAHVEAIYDYSMQPLLTRGCVRNHLHSIIGGLQQNKNDDRKI